MIDIGVNLDHSAFLNSLEQFRDDYHLEGVQSIICIASNMTEAEQLQSWCAPFDDMHYTLGCHPHHASTWQSEHQSKLINWFRNDPKAIAVGEMGLDFNRNYSSPEQQVIAFEAQLEIASTVSKPIYLHERDAFDTMKRCLAPYQSKVQGVIHCFTGDKTQLVQYLDMGLYVGITGWLLDERRNHELVAALEYLPLDRILLETDAPYLAPRNIRPRPKYNHPKYLKYIAEEVAQLKRIQLEDVIQASVENTKKLFFGA